MYVGFVWEVTFDHVPLAETDRYNPSKVREKTLLCITPDVQIADLDRIIEKTLGDFKELQLVYKKAVCLGPAFGESVKQKG